MKFSLLFFLFLLIYSDLFAATKIKTKQVNNIIKVKTLIVHPMVGEEEAKRYNKKISYLSRITFEVGGKLVYNLHSSPYLANRPILSFQFRSQDRSNTIMLTTIDNNGNVKKLSSKIKSYKKVSPTQSLVFKQTKKLQINPSVWKAPTSTQAIKILYSKDIPTDNIIKVIAPKLAANSASIPIQIITDLDLVSIAIFKDLDKKLYWNNAAYYDLQPHATIAIFEIPNSAIIDYKLRIKLLNTSTITVVAKDKTGRLYKTVIKIDAWIGGDNCS